MANVLNNGMKETELGSLPEDWDVVRLSEIAKLTSGGTPSKKRLDFWEGPIPWASPKDLKRPRLLDTEDHISQAGLDDGSRLVPAGSLFVVVRGMILSKDLPVAMAMVPMAFNQDMKAICPGDRIDGDFLLQAFTAYKRRLAPEIGTSAHGTRRISTSSIEDFLVPLPPLPEQRAIALVLRTVQRAKEATEKAIAATRTLKQSLMRHLFTYGPVPFDQADQVELKETAIGAVPSDWKDKTLGDCARLATGGTPDRRNSEYWNGGIPWVKTGEINYSVIRSTEETISEAGLNNSNARPFPIGTLLVAMYGQGVTRGRVARLGIEATTNQACAAIFPCDGVDTDFLYHYFVHNYQRIREMGHGANQRNLSMTMLKTVKLHIPPFPEQRTIASLLSPLDTKLQNARARVSALDALFTSLLHSLMIGKVRVNDLDLAESIGGNS